MELTPVIENLKSKTYSQWDVWQISRLAGPEAVPALTAALKQATLPATGLVEALGRCRFETQAAAEEACRVIADHLALKGAKVAPAAEALARIAHPVAVPALNRILLENWPSSDFTARLLAMIGLARTKSPSAAHALLHALSGGISGPGVFDTCAWNQLARLTDVPLPVSGDGPVEVRILAAWCLGMLKAPEAAEPLVSALHDRVMDKIFLQVAMPALTDVAEDYLERLRPFLAHVLARARYAALTALERKDPRRHVEEFREALKHADPWVRFAGARGLASAGSNEGAHTLLELLDQWTTEPECRQAIFQLAGRLDLPELIPLAFKRMTAFMASEGERAAAGSALAAVVSRTSVEQVRALADKSEWKLADVLARIDTLLQQGTASGVQAAIVFLRALEGRFGKLLEKNFEGAGFLKAKQAAALALAASGAAGDTAPWIARLDHYNPEVAELAFWVLATKQDPACQPRLLEILAHVPETGKLGKLFGVDKTKAPAYVRRKMLACLALAHCGNEAALRPLAACSRDANQDIRAAAAAALAEIGLRHVSASVSAGVPAALEAVWQIPSYALRAALARYFAAAGHSAAVPLLVAQLEDGYGAGPFARYREVLVRALGKLADAAAVPALARAALADPDPGVRQAAGRALSPKAAPEQPWKSIAAAREELNARAAAALRAEVLAKRDAAPRFLDLFKSETLLAPAGTPGDVAFELQTYRACMPLCCAVCLEPAERYSTVSVGVPSGMNKTIIHFLPVPLCGRCCLPPGLLLDFSPVELTTKEQHWVAAFRNPRFETMTADRGWLATATDSCRSIFKEVLEETAETPAAAAAVTAAAGAAAAATVPTARPAAATASATTGDEIRQAEDLFYQGKRSFLEGQWEQAAAALAQAVTFAPRSAASQFLLGASLAQLGRFEEALQPLTLSVELNPLQADAQNTLGMTLGKLGRIEEAERHMARAAYLGHVQAREVLRNTGMDYCRSCASPMRQDAARCPQCGAS